LIGLITPGVGKVTTPMQGDRQRRPTFWPDPHFDEESGRRLRATGNRYMRTDLSTTDGRISREHLQQAVLLHGDDAMDSLPGEAGLREELRQRVGASAAHLLCFLPVTSCQVRGSAAGVVLSAALRDCVGATAGSCVARRCAWLCRYDGHRRILLSIDVKSCTSPTPVAVIFTSPPIGMTPFPV
jgi:hypothetical protein